MAENERSPLGVSPAADVGDGEVEKRIEEASLSAEPNAPVPAAPEKRGRPRRLGFMAGYANVPDDFDQLAAEEIVSLFEGEN